MVKRQMCCLYCCIHNASFLEYRRNSVNTGWQQSMGAWKHWLSVVTWPMAVEVQRCLVANAQSKGKTTLPVATQRLLMELRSLLRTPLSLAEKVLKSTLPRATLPPPCQNRGEITFWFSPTATWDSDKCLWCLMEDTLSTERPVSSKLPLSSDVNPFLWNQTPLFVAVFLK